MMKEEGRYHVKVHANGKEERETRGKLINVHSCLDTGPAVLETVGDRESQLKHVVRPSLLHVIPRN